MNSVVQEEVTIAVAFIAMMMILVIALRVLPLFLQHRQMRWLLDERRLLIEKGVTTDLSPLQLPETVKRRDPLANLKAGMLLFFVATGLFAPVLYYYRVTDKPLFPPPSRPQPMTFEWFTPVPSYLFGDAYLQIQIALLLGAMGLALVLIHFFARAYERRAHRSENGESIQQSKAGE